LAQEYAERVLQTPISEATWMTAAVGAAVQGLRPVVNVMNASFAAMGFDAVLNQAGAWPWMTAGKQAAAMVFRAVVGAGVQGGYQHSAMLHSLFSQVPGFKVVLPSTPQDAYSLFVEAVADPGPVVFLEHVLTYHQRGEVNTAMKVPIGSARLVKPGRAVTVVTCGAMVAVVLEAQKNFAEDAVAVVDLRTIEPLDLATVMQSLKETHRLIVVDEAPLRASVAPKVVAGLLSASARMLDRPPVMVTAPDVPIPYAAHAERAYVPDPKRIAQAIGQVLSP
jgi:pyruvate dehydrogenase E1 component beta subunit